jgi:hypothetical protein
MQPSRVDHLSRSTYDYRHGIRIWKRGADLRVENANVLVCAQAGAEAEGRICASPGLRLDAPGLAE